MRARQILGTGWFQTVQCRLHDPRPRRAGWDPKAGSHRRAGRHRVGRGLRCRCGLPRWSNMQSRRLLNSRRGLNVNRIRLRTDSHSVEADAVAGGLGRSFVQVRGENINALLVIADLGAPKILDLLGMLACIQHAPATNAQLAIGKRNGGQFHAHAVKLGNKSFHVKVRHFRFPLKRWQTFYAARSYALDFYAA